MQNNKKTISLCMITLNEARFIEDALNNIKNYVDEIIIVDGGSGDNTVEIAKKFNAHVYLHKWADDFSVQRNHAIEYATKDWILFMDADETYEKELLNNLNQWTNNNIDIDMFAFPRKNYIDGKQTDAYPDKQLRFFKNNKNIKYINKVHEILTGYSMVAFPVNLHIIHKKSLIRQEKQNNYYLSLSPK